MASFYLNLKFSYKYAGTIGLMDLHKRIDHQLYSLRSSPLNSRVLHLGGGFGIYITQRYVIHKFIKICNPLFFLSLDHTSIVRVTYSQ
ncbi:hypothetical protein Hdeb2414_s0065g00766271 [Helianthus debilis subsp. tardiflorus]